MYEFNDFLCNYVPLNDITGLAVTPPGDISKPVLQQSRVLFFCHHHIWLLDTSQANFETTCTYFLTFSVVSNSKGHIDAA